MRLFSLIFIILLVGGIAFLFAWNQQEGSDLSVKLEVGDEAPYFELKDQDKNLRKLTDYRGERLVVYFFPKADTPG